MSLQNLFAEDYARTRSHVKLLFPVLCFFYSDALLQHTRTHQCYSTIFAYTSVFVPLQYQSIIGMDCSTCYWICHSRYKSHLSLRTLFISLYNSTFGGHHRYCTLTGLFVYLALFGLFFGFDTLALLFRFRLPLLFLYSYLQLSCLPVYIVAQPDSVAIQPPLNPPFTSVISPKLFTLQGSFSRTHFDCILVIMALYTSQPVASDLRNT
jgi:hypothetical protein